MLGIASVFLKGNTQIHLHCIFKPHVCHKNQVRSEKSDGFISHWGQVLSTTKRDWWLPHCQGGKGTLPARTSHSLHANWKNRLLPVSAGLATSSHTVQTLLAGELAEAPENYKMMNFSWTREIARVNYEPLFRRIGEEDITILNT